MSGKPFPSPGDLPDPGTELGSPVYQADSQPSEPPGKPYITDMSINKIMTTPKKREKEEASMEFIFPESSGSQVVEFQACRG